MLDQRAIGKFLHYKTPENALRKLRDSGFLMDCAFEVEHDINHQIEQTGAHTSNQLAGANQVNHSHNHAAEGGARKDTVAGTTLGAVTGLLVGLGAIAIPGAGLII